jgi:hypothetical protein
MRVLLFQPQFAEAVRSGVKCQTIRPPRIRPITIGTELSLRRWLGAPYRSKQEELRKGICFRASRIKIVYHMIWINEIELSEEEAHDVARHDGFESVDKLMVWFKQVHSLPFEGTLLKWKV